MTSYRGSSRHGPYYGLYSSLDTMIFIERVPDRRKVGVLVVCLKPKSRCRNRFLYYSHGKRGAAKMRAKNFLLLRVYIANPGQQEALS
ncbi:hypothetical protein AMTR_s00135p00048720 [Amborella trichopoda]|uniref:Uncharacterized protein n=1 Tax=Amborella trichopoda TaxID=13333 RepID=W1P5F1_AMBTC|nr:hypothetical protein AMTR_s00135p00048720 [Amborella trichopoda]